MTTPQSWEVLFGHALSLIDDVLRHGTKDLYWTFGGGTVLMLRYNHRFSKDIDIFVPDPQALGFVTPRLSSYAETLTTDYTEAANFVKLFLPEGEIDFLASPNLTDDPYVLQELQELQGRMVKVETSAEIIAKKFWHRGDRLTARDIFDFRPRGRARTGRTRRRGGVPGPAHRFDTQSTREPCRPDQAPVRRDRHPRLYAQLRARGGSAQGASAGVPAVTTLRQAIDRSPACSRS